MIRSEKRIKELNVILDNQDDNNIALAIAELRNSEPFEGAIQPLSMCYDRNLSQPVRKAIEEFMNDLKDPELRSEIIAEIRNDHKPATTRMLVSSCWQSGLDYSEYLNDFAEVFLKSDYATAIECFTVIEEALHSTGRAEKDKIISMLENNPFPESDPRKILENQLISVLGD
jgi:predicted DNA-binding protein